MKSLIVIPARYASSRFPGKPLVPLRGPDGIKSLVQRSWEAARSVRGISRVVIATDDDRILAHATGFGADVVMTSTDARNGTERCAEVATMLPGFDVVVNLQGDAPLIPPAFVEEILRALADNPDAEMATPVLRCDGQGLSALLADRKAGRVGGTTAIFDRTGKALYFSKEVIPFTARAYGADEPTPVFHHVGLYAYRPEALSTYPRWPVDPLEMQEGLEQLRFLENGRRVLCVEVRSGNRKFWEVNNPSDVPIIEALLATQG